MPVFSPAIRAPRQPRRFVTIPSAPSGEITGQVGVVEASDTYSISTGVLVSAIALIREGRRPVAQAPLTAILLKVESPDTSSGSATVATLARLTKTESPDTLFAQQQPAILLTWTDTVIGEDGIRVKWGTSSGVYTQSADKPADSTSHQITSGLVANTTYYWIAVGLLAGVEQTPSAEATFNTFPL
jgi:hypothetical protein